MSRFLYVIYKQAKTDKQKNKKGYEKTVWFFHTLYILAHAQLFIVSYMGLDIFGLHLLLNPYFVCMYVNSQGSGESAHMCMHQGPAYVYANIHVHKT